MKEITKVVVDAMGGDNAPHEIIKGAVEAVGKSDAIHVILVGKRYGDRLMTNSNPLRKS